MYRAGTKSTKQNKLRSSANNIMFGKLDFVHNDHKPMKIEFYKRTKNVSEIELKIA